MTTFEFNILRTLGLIVGPALERFAIATHLLHQYGSEAVFKVEDFQKRCVLMAQRISLLTGATDTELPSPQVFGAIFDQLSESGMIECVGQDQWKLTASFTDVLGLTSSLLSVDMRHSLARAKG
jgi:glycerol-3-phosphate O-acyltransferase